MIPYMRGNLARKRRGLARADAIVAVSRRIAADLRGRAPELDAVRMEIIPNPVNVADLRAMAASDGHPTGAAPYALYLGKLAVAESHRGQGLARQLVDLAASRARALGLPAL